VRRPGRAGRRDAGSHLADEARFRADNAANHAAATERGMPGAVGGFALAPEVRARTQHAASGDHVQHLAGFVRTLEASRESALGE
jgi:hypothetical protein